MGTDQPTNQPTDQQTNQRTDKAGFRVACTWLKNKHKSRSNTIKTHPKLDTCNEMSHKIINICTRHLSFSVHHWFFALVTNFHEMVLLNALVLIPICAQSRTQYFSQILRFKQTMKLAPPPISFGYFSIIALWVNLEKKIRQKIVNIFLKCF